MRAVAVTAIGLLLVGLAGANPATSAEPEPLHPITCISTRVARAYEEGLRALYLNRVDESIKAFQDASKRDPDCAMAQWGLSRALDKKGSATEALAAAEKAHSLGKKADDREQQLINGWRKLLIARGKPEADKAKELGEVRSDLDRAIAIYPHDPELWLLRGTAAESPLRAALFNLAALRLRPDHPFGSSWSAQAPPLPELTPKPTQAVPPVSAPPALFEGLGVLSHPVTTSNPQAQAYYEQGLRCWHSYVSPMRNRLGAGANFQHAANLDPNLAMAYWGISLCAQRGDVISPINAANRALELAQKYGSDKERRFCAARVLEQTASDQQAEIQRLRSDAEKAGADRAGLQAQARELVEPQRKTREAFLDALDGAVIAYPDDVELWIWRGKAHGVSAAAIPYQLVAHRMKPEHPSPNHEMVHAYEGIDRPALGWPHTWGYRRSAPNMPHANHMQGHLAMRLGRWQEAIDCSRTARKMSLAGFPELDPSHHIDIMIRSLAHEGRFKEAEAEPRAYRDGLPWARLLQLKGVPEELEAWVARRLAIKAIDGYYVGAIAKLDRNDLQGVLPLMDHVEQQWKKQPANIYRYNEIKGRYLVQSGNAEEGLKLLKEAGAKAVKDSGMHAWGGGSYVLEVWGEAALRLHRWDDAEEAYHEALAHEHGSILGALGMQVVWEQRGRPEMAAHYAARAATIWKGADEGALERHLQRLRRLASNTAASVAPARPSTSVP